MLHRKLHKLMSIFLLGIHMISSCTVETNASLEAVGKADRNFIHNLEIAQRVLQQDTRPQPPTQANTITLPEVALLAIICGTIVTVIAIPVIAFKFDAYNLGYNNGFQRAFSTNIYQNIILQAYQAGQDNMGFNNIQGMRITQ